MSTLLQERLQVGTDLLDTLHKPDTKKGHLQRHLEGITRNEELDLENDTAGNKETAVRMPSVQLRHR